MTDQSQIDDMRAAIRGDRERAQARREADPWRTPAPDPEPEPEREPLLDVVEEPQPDPVAEAPEPEPAAEEPPHRRGFFSSIFGRD